MENKILTKEMILNAIGKELNSEEFKTIFLVLGEADEIDWYDESCYFTWEKKGIEILFESNKLDNVKIFIEPDEDYPYSAKKFIDIKDWHYDLNKEGLIQIYGEPQNEIEAKGYSHLFQSDTKFRIIYEYNGKSIDYSFTPNDTDKVTEIDIGLPFQA